MEQLKAQYFYRAYGLDIRSSIVLPELRTSNRAIENNTIFVNVSGTPVNEDNPLPDRRYQISPAKAFICFSEVGFFYINEGREINIVPLRNVEARLVRVPLLGASMAVLLYQLGNFVLHASAVSVEGRAVAFMGDKGFGKSTMAAMFCGLGHELLADDVVAIDLNEVEGPTILPGFPQLKLYPDSAIAAFNDDPEKLPPIASSLTKLSRLADKFCEAKTPLRAIYVLRENDNIGIKRLESQEAVKALICNSYLSRFSADWLINGLAVSNLQHCVKTVNHIPVFSLERPRNLSKLKDVALAVEEHTASLHEIS